MKRSCLGISTIYHNGTTHIPVSVRKALNLKDGDKILWVMEGEKLVVEPAEQETLPRYSVLRH